ncbi:hypothetical protein LR48_Vigan09g002300 [Vigna angularis]|uniref:Uncharacterized protein n=1 Tax=Phaseolus angularis TaxID=3914 RepID=A0A0L9V9P7_PHAAN|nr:hypothetical protein LR48_Vigan09g002300 [Vigna angularis]
MRRVVRREELFDMGLKDQENIGSSRKDCQIKKLSDHQGRTVGFRLGEDCWILAGRGLSDLHKRGLPDQEVIKKGREENICGEEDKDENCDGDISVTAAEKVAKAVVFTAVEKVAKVFVFSGHSVVSCGVNVKTVKTRKKRQGGGENASNWEQKEEDATNNNGARKGEETPIFSWVKREELITYEGIDTQDQTTRAANAFKVQNTKGSTKAHPNKIVEGNRRSSICENWTTITQMGSVEILHESLQVEGAVAKSVVATTADEVKVEIRRTSQNWAKRIQEEWKSLEENLPPPKPPDLNWRAALITV